MRKNAIIRIIIWSIILALLLGFLALGLGFSLHRARRALRTDSYAATAIPTRLKDDEDTNLNSDAGTAKWSIDVYSTPNDQSQVMGTIKLGDDVTIERTDTINGQQWSYISSPVTGWVRESSPSASDDGEAPLPSTVSSGTYTAADNVNIRKSPSMSSEAVGVLKSGETALVEKTEYTNGTHWAYITSPAKGWIVAKYLNVPEAFTVPANEVREISVEWAAGEITIKAAAVSDICFYETEDSKHPMVWKVKDGKLDIDYSEDIQVGILHFGNLSFADKDLTILVPQDWSCDELELDTASTALRLSDLTVRKVDVDSASGVCRFQNCHITDLDIDTASGDVFLEGTLNTLDFDAASAKFTGVLYNTPSRIVVDSMSGDLDLTLPEDTGFTVKMDGMSNGFTSDFPTTARNGSHVCGDGRCVIEVDGMSSDVVIRKNGNLPVTEALPTEASAPKSLLPSEAPAAPEAPTAPEAPPLPNPLRHGYAVPPRSGGEASGFHHCLTCQKFEPRPWLPLSGGAVTAPWCRD